MLSQWKIACGVDASLSNYRCRSTNGVLNSNVAGLVAQYPKNEVNQFLADWFVNAGASAKTVKESILHIQ
jgi:hypothetical protein